MNILHESLRAFVEHATGDAYRAALEPFERELFRVAHEVCQGNQVHIAQRLGLDRNTVRKKLMAHGLLVPRRRRA